jgi:hypothetical protein
VSAVRVAPIEGPLVRIRIDPRTQRDGQAVLRLAEAVSLRNQLSVEIARIAADTLRLLLDEPQPPPTATTPVVPISVSYGRSCSMCGVELPKFYIGAVCDHCLHP